MSDPSIVSEEERLLEKVATFLEEHPYDLPPSEKSLVDDLVRIREEMPRAKGEDLGALMGQYNLQFALLQQLRAARDKPQVDPDSPYFAHLRLKEDGNVRDLCLGKATRIDGDVRIVDWRHAPVSRIFYRYQQGEEYEEELGGRPRVGEVVARRTVTIQRGDLVRVDSPEGQFDRRDEGWVHSRREPPRLAGGEGEALRVYQAGEGSGRRMGTDLQGSRRRVDKRLPDIAGLIDEDQFGLITRPSSGFVVIRGTAGSGKTTVALHRIAWLAYADPSVNSERTLFIVFSPALRDYVAHVLPSLGVHRVKVVAYRDWAAQQRVRHFPRLPRRIRDDTPSVVVRLKTHPALLLALAEQRERVSGAANGPQALDDWASVLGDFALLKSVFKRADPTAFTERELEVATRWCRDRHEEMLTWMDGDKEVDAALDVEDDALLLRAWQLRAGPLRTKRKRPLNYRHLAIDEVQDFSPLEVRVLLECLDKNQSITLAGDTQQHVMKEAGFTSWEDFFRHLGVEGTSVDTLRVAYRSSREVVTFSMGVLGELREDDDPPITTRSGPEVELFRFTDHGACVAFVADALKDLTHEEPLASIAVLTPGSDISALYYSGLKSGEVPRLRRVSGDSFTFAPGVEVTEVEQVKGLEYDYIVLVEVSAQRYPDTPAARRLLHVGATRAVHQLWLVTVGEPSSIVRPLFP